MAEPSASITVRLTPELVNDLNEQADQLDRSLSWLVRDLLKSGLTARNAKWNSVAVHGQPPLGAWMKGPGDDSIFLVTDADASRRFGDDRMWLPTDFVRLPEVDDIMFIQDPKDA
jgi:hypothetical protein